MMLALFSTRTLGGLVSPRTSLSTSTLSGVRTLATAATKTATKPAAKEKEKEAPKAAPVKKAKEEKGEKPKHDPSVPREKLPWTNQDKLKLLRLVERFEQHSITRDPSPLPYVQVPLVTTWKELAAYFPGRTISECRGKYLSLEHKAFQLGTSPFNYHPLSMFPSPPSPQQKRWFLAYAYNFLQLRGNLPDGDPRRQVTLITLSKFMRSLKLSFHYRDDTFEHILTSDGAPFFAMEGGKIYLKDKIAPEHFKQIRHLVFNKDHLEKEICDTMVGYFNKRTFVTLSELKGHVLASKRLSELYFKIIGDLSVFLNSNEQAKGLLSLLPNDENPRDPVVILGSAGKGSTVVDVTATETPAAIESPESAEEEEAPPA